MAKIEELTEILVNEIEDFNKRISKLEAISNKINTTKVGIDLREYKSIIESHQQKMNEQINSQERFESRFASLLKTAKVYPNWAVIVFIISFMFGVVSTPYAYFLKQDVNNLEKEAFEKGVASYNNHVQFFFESHPKSKQAFEKWKEKVEKN